MKIRLVIVDDHVLLRDGIAKILKDQPDFDVVGEAGSVEGAVKIVQATKPDLILMDYSLPDGNGLMATRKILASNPGIDIVILTIHEDEDFLFEAIRSGANGYLLKNIPTKELLSRLRGLAKGEAAINPKQTRLIMAELAKTKKRTMPAKEDLPSLTDRELEVLGYLVQGATNREIAMKLVISPNTVKNHVHNILEKLQVSGRREAAEAAIERQLIDSTNH